MLRFNPNQCRASVSVAVPAARHVWYFPRPCVIAPRSALRPVLHMTHKNNNSKNYETDEKMQVVGRDDPGAPCKKFAKRPSLRVKYHIRRHCGLYPQSHKNTSAYTKRDSASSAEWRGVIKSCGAPSRRALRIDQILRVFIVIIFVGYGEFL